MGIVAEDGPEAIIPLGGKRRQRGLELYQRAGALLGLKPAERMQPEGTESASGLMYKAGTPFVWIQQSGVYQTGMPVRLNAEGGIFGKIASGKVIERDSKSEPRPRSWNIFEIRGENIKKAEPESLRLEREEDRRSGHEVSVFDRLTEALGAGSMPSEQAEALHIPEQKADGMSEAVYQIHYAPVFNLTGAASSVANDIRQAARLSQEEFARYMQRWQKDKRRLSF